MKHEVKTDWLLKLAREAGELIMRYYTDEKAMNVQVKGDHSPVTDADIAANDLIVTALKNAFPEVPVVAEESTNEAAAKSGYFWLVDPLDGTKSFIKRTGEFTVNIGLVENGLPVLGVVFAPAKNLMYVANHNEAFQQMEDGSLKKLKTRTVPQSGAVVVASASHRTPETDAYISTIKVDRLVSASSSLKFCLVAAGEADVYPRFGTTMEWDTAAADAVLRAAGGRMEKPDGSAFTYGKEGFVNPHFIAYGK